MVRSFLGILFSVFFASHAWGAPSNFSYQGQIIKPNGQALEANPVNFTIEILSPAPSECVLYKEQHTLNMTNSNGIFALEVGSGAQSGANYEDVNSLADAINNSIGVLTPSTCLVGPNYNPTNGDGRQMRVTFNDGTGPNTLSQNHQIVSVPYADSASSIDGLAAADLLTINNGGSFVLTQANLEWIFANSARYAELQALINGTSSNYMSASPSGDVSMNSQRIIDVANPTLATDATNKQYVDGNIGGQAADTVTMGGLGAGQTGNVMVWNGTQWTAAAPAGDSTKLPLAGGTMTGAIDMGAQNITNANNVTANSVGANSVAIYNGANYMGFQAAGGSADLLWTLPNSDGSANQALVTDNAGNLSWRSFVESGSNQGAGGVGPFIQNNNGDLEFKNINAGSSKITLTNDAGNNEIDVDVDDTQLNLGNIPNTPAGAIAAGNAQAAINELDSEKVAKAGDVMTGSLTMNAQNELRFADNDSSNFVGLAAPNVVGADFTWYLPAADGGNGDVLQTDGAGNLSFVSLPSAPIQSASNQNAGGVGVYKQLNGTDLEFRGINAENNKVSVTLDGPNNEIDIGINEANFDPSAIPNTPNGNITANNVQAAIDELDSEKIDSGRAINTAVGSGLQGGGDLTADRSLSIDIPNVADFAATVANGDTILMYDASAPGMVEIQRSAFVLSESEVDGFVSNNGYVESASNQGAGGVGLFSAKNGTDLEFKNINAGSAKITVSNDAGNTEVDIDVDESQFDLGAIPNTAVGNIAAGNAQAAINELDNEKVAKAGDNMTGALTMNAQNEIRFADADSSNFVGFAAPATVGSDLTWTLPDADGGAGHVLQTDGAGGLSFVPIPSAPLQSVSNQNAGGVGVYKQVNGTDIEMRGINAASSKVSVALDAGNNEIDIDVSEANLDAGLIPNTPNGNIGSTDLQSAIDELDSEKISDVTGSALADGQIWVGNGGVATEVAMSGDVGMDNTGNTTIQANAVTSGMINDGEIVDADISASADITRTKMATGSINRVLINDGSGEMSEAAAIANNRALASDANGLPVASSVTDTELSYLSGVTSAIQTQIDGKQDDLGYVPVNQAGDTMSGQLFIDGGADEVQLAVDGVAGQTANLIEIRNSASAVVASVSADGSVTNNTDLATKLYVDTEIATLSGGTVTAGSNVGAGGADVFKQNNLGTLEFNGINDDGNGKVVVTQDVVNNEIDLTVNESNLDPGVIPAGTTTLSAANLEAALNELDADKAEDSLSLTAGAGLTGGGDLTANRSFDVGAGAGIQVNADDIAINIPGVADFAATVDAADTILMYDSSATSMVEIARSAFVLSESEVDAYANDNGYLNEDGTVALTANWDVGGTYTVTNLPAPSSNSDAATKLYVDTAVSGISADEIHDADNNTKIQVEEGANDDTIRFDTAGTERMVIDPSGNVGIGTSTPTSGYKLDVMSALRIGHTNGSIGSAQMINNASTTSGSGSEIRFRSGSINNAALVVGVGSSINESYMGFHTRTASSTAERMRIDSTGYVGIGTNNPASMLEVAGDIQIGNSGVACSAANPGALRFNGGNVEFCDGGTTWTAFGTAAGGEVNVATNGGSSGESLVLAKSGVNLPFKSIDAGSTKVSVSTNGGNNSVEIDVNEANLDADLIPVTPAGGIAASTVNDAIFELDTEMIRDVTGSTLTDGQIWVGNAGSATEVAMSGDVAMNNLGATTIQADAVESTMILDDEIVDADINSAANIAATKLGTGVVDNTEFNYLNGVTSAIQTQLDGKVNDSGDIMTGQLLIDGGADEVQLAIEGTLLQTTNLVEVRDSTSAVVASISSDGTITAATDLTTKSYVDSAISGFSADEIHDADNNTKIQVEEGANDDTIRFDTAGTERMVILSSGNVGIGTTTPTSRLSLFGTIGDFASSGISFGDGDTGFYETADDFLAFKTEGTDRLFFSNTGDISSNTGHGYEIDNQNTVTFVPQSGDSDTGMGGPAVDNLGFYTAGVERVRIDASGKVGIGTSTMSAELHVHNGEIKLTNEDNWGGFNTFQYSDTKFASNDLRRARGTIAVPTYVQSDDKIGQFSFMNHTNSSKAAGMEGVATQGHNATRQGTKLTFHTTLNGNNSASERMVIDHDGEVGIGTDAPNATLDVNGIIRAQQICDEAGNNCQDISGGWGGGGDFMANGSVPFSGNILTFSSDSADRINVNSPTFRIDLDANDNDGGEEFVVSKENGNRTFMAVREGQLDLNRDTGDAIGAILYMNKNRSSSLVNAQDEIGQLIGRGDDGAAMREAASITMAVDGTPAAGDMPGRIEFATSLDGTTTPVERMRISNSGNVGIGTSNPSAPLHVVGAVNFDRAGASPNISMRRAEGTMSAKVVVDSGKELWRLDGSGWDGSTWYEGGKITMTAEETFSGTNGGTNIRFHTTPLGTVTQTEAMRISADGNVGIGTNAPDVALDVGTGVINASSICDEDNLNCFDISAGVSGGVTADSLDFDDLSDAMTLDATTTVDMDTIGADLNFDSNTFFIDSSANSVGIGTNSPAASLHISANPGVANSVALIDKQENTAGNGPAYLLRRARDSAGTPSATQSGDILGVLGAKGYGSSDWHPVSTSSITFLATETHTDSARGTSIDFQTTQNGTSARTSKMIIQGNGNIGIGTSNPTDKLVINGTIRNLAAIDQSSNTTIDFTSGNIQYTGDNCQAFTLHNMRSGGSYTFVVQGTTSATCSFTAYSDDGTGAPGTQLTVHMPAGHAATTNGKHTIYTAIVAGSHIYFAWVPDL